MISWDDCLNKLFQFTHRKNRDLKYVFELDQKLGYPHRSFPSIHVGGTNGKGSVCLKIAKGLEAAGLKVGLYSSPHISDVRERIRINGKMIEKKEMILLFESLYAFSQNLSYFDLMTLLAFQYFKDQQVDFAVVEVGLGGRFDATNIITPQLAIITSIGLDHTELLGETLEEIAFEKGGIAKENIPLIVGPSAAPFFPKAKATEAVPFFEQENQLIAKAALSLLGLNTDAVEIKAPFRFEMRGNLILDAAHNPAAFEKLIEALQIHFPEKKKFHFIVAFAKDKDWRGCLDLILPWASSIAAVRMEGPRFEPPESLKEYAPEVQLEVAIMKDDLNVITGSFYLMDLIQKREGAFSLLASL